MLSSKNVTSAENWQERPDIAWWIVGFVDGEGSFCVSIFRNTTTATGWQVFPEFVITQGKKSRTSLVEVKQFFGVGEIYENRRFDNHTENLLRYCVRSRKELRTVIVPFFKLYPLRTAKIKDFEKFVKCLDLIENGDHLTVSGLKRIATITQSMNRKKRSGQSGILRGHTSGAPTGHRGEDMVHTTRRLVEEK